MEDTLKTIYAGVLQGDREVVSEQVQAMLDGGTSPEAILNDGMIAAMAEVGRLFEAGEYYVPEMMVAARAMQTGLTVLRPALLEADVQPVGKVVLGTVKGDLHDIGKNLVGMMLEGNGFAVVDLGVDVSAAGFIEAVKGEAPQVLGMSALLTTTMPEMKNVITAMEQAGVRGKVKIMVGGAPITDAYAQEIGADGFAPDASQAVTLAKSLI